MTNPVIIADEDFVKAAYEVILSRMPDENEIKNWVKYIRDSGITRYEAVNQLINSPEFLNLYITRGDVLKFWEGLHHVRVDMVKKLLPKGDFILDIGGASPADHRGALLNFGYPYLPKRLYIVDLPPQDRMLLSVEKSDIIMHDGCGIRYFYRSMADLACFEEGAFDFIWSGQSIEHVAIEEGKEMLKQIYRLLKPGGRFALDTPNRRATIIQVPTCDTFIHPEHKHEYYFEELSNMLEENGFKIEIAKGLIDLSESIKSSRFITSEYYRNLSINDDPENSYVFYICCKRPE